MPMNYAPKVGTIVNYVPAGPQERTNGALYLPAIVTRVWSDTCVNLTVFGDAEPPFTKASANLGKRDFVPATGTWQYRDEN